MVLERERQGGATKHRNKRGQGRQARPKRHMKYTLAFNTHVQALLTTSAEGHIEEEEERAVGFVD